MRFFTAFLILLFPCLSFSQKETSHWFMTGTRTLVEPTGVTPGKPVPQNFGGLMPTSVSDAAGNLLFASNGNFIIDRDLQRMPASASVNLGAVSGSVLAQKLPASTKFLLFYTVSNGTSPVNSSWTLKYAVIDMALNNGKGDLVSYNHIIAADLSPGYTLVQQPNSQEAWVVTHRLSTKNFNSYRITAAGVSAIPVASIAGSHATPGEYDFRDLKTSPNGTLIAGFSYFDLGGPFALTRAFVEVFNIDPASGVVTTKVATVGGTSGSYFYTYQSVEFSPDSRLLYVSYVTRADGLQPCGFGSTIIYQYNLCYTDPVEFRRYVYQIVNQFIFCFPMSTYGRIQLGADKRIHMPFTGVDVSTIEFPNRVGNSATYARAKYQVAVPNSGNITTPRFQHRDLEKAVKNNISYSGTCSPSPTRFYITNDTIARIEWDFGDPASGASNFSTQLAPTHIFSAAGKYNVTARLFNSLDQLIETVPELVEIKDPLKRLLDGYPSDTTFCEGGKLDINLEFVNGIFVWFKKDRDGVETEHRITEHMTLSYSEKWYVRLQQKDCNDCTLLDSINIKVLPKPSVGLGTDRNICNGDSVELRVYDPAATYLWSNGSTGSSLWVKTSGVYWVEGQYNNNGCPARDSINVTVIPPVIFSLPSDTTLCNNQTLLLEPGISPATYVWQDGSTSPRFLVESPGKYRVRITNAGGCSSSDSIVVSYVSAAQVNLGRDSLLCQGESLTLQADIPGVTNLWSNGTAGNQITVNQSGSYWVRVDNGTCVVTDTIVLRFDNPPLLNIGADTVLCPGEKLALNPGLSAAQYLWQDGSAAPSYVVSNAGTYWVNLSRGGCDVGDTISIRYFTGQPVTLGPDRRVCEDEAATFEAGNSFISYAWNTGGTTSSVTVSAPGQYIVTTTNADGCRSKDTVLLLSPYPLPVVNLVDNPALCYNTSRVLDAGSGFVRYVWDDGSGSRTRVVNGTGTFSVTVQDANGCSGADATTVSTILPLPAKYLPEDLSICQYETIQIQPSTQFSSYKWSNNSTSFAVKVSQAGTYTLEVTDTKGCVGKDTINVLAKDCMHGVYIPSAFSPDGDGLNDQFKPLVYGPVSQYRFTIYNRWGEIVFQSAQPGKGWDGTFKGLTQSTGIFIWSCTYQIPGQEFLIRKGQVTLVR